MIHYSIFFEKYGWEIEVFIVVENSDVSKVYRSLAALHCPEDIMYKVYDNMNSGLDSGFTYTNEKSRKSLMVIGKSSSMHEFINTYNHEKNHVEMHICEELNIDPYSEEAAYLSGELAQQLFLPAVCSYLV